MIDAGKDIRFIMRRLLILAAEDIGLADPQAICVVSACAQAMEWCGLPEAQYHLAEATLYLATTPKSNSVGAYWKAKAEVRERGAGDVPDYLKDSTRDGEAPGHGKGYKYPHAYPGHWVQQRYLPEGVEGGWYEPGDQGHEAKIKRWLRRRGAAPSRGEEHQP